MRRTSNQIPKLHIRKNDMVKVLSGDDKGKTGKVLEIFPEKRRAIVDGVNIVTRHTKPSAKVPDGGRIEKPAPVHISKLMLIDPKSGQPTRVGRKLDKKDKLVRYAKKSQEEI